MLCSWARHLTLTVPLSTQEYKMGTGEFTAEGKPSDELESHPGGSRNTPSRCMLQKPEISADLMGHLARMLVRS